MNIFFPISQLLHRKKLDDLCSIIWNKKMKKEEQEICNSDAVGSFTNALSLIISNLINYQM
jgi:hypothetical protein